MIRDFIPVHDNFLGKLDLGNMTKSSHPFYKTRRAGDRFDRIESKGWHVKGDGNCGYYALVLALQNVGIMEYFVDTKSMSRKEGSLATTSRITAPTSERRIRGTIVHNFPTGITQQGTGILGNRAWYIQRQGSNRIVEFIRDPRKSVCIFC